MKTFAYLLDDPTWPPTLHEVRNTDPETDLVIVSPVGNPQRVLYVYQEDLWVMASI